MPYSQPAILKVIITVSEWRAEIPKFLRLMTPGVIELNCQLILWPFHLNNLCRPFAVVCSLYIAYSYCLYFYIPMPQSLEILYLSCLYLQLFPCRNTPPPPKLNDSHSAALSMEDQPHNGREQFVYIERWCETSHVNLYHKGSCYDVSWVLSS